eukprot:gene5194-8800_t
MEKQGVSIGYPKRRKFMHSFTAQVLRFSIFGVGASTAVFGIYLQIVEPQVLKDIFASISKQKKE